MSNESFELLPLHFVYPGVFWALEGRQGGGHILSLLQDLTERITIYALSPEAVLLEQFQSNGHCIAMLDSIWARGQCRRRLRRKFDYLVEVFFLDYGVYRNLGMEEILEMPDLFKEIRPLAKRYGLYGTRVAEEFEASLLLQERWERRVDELLAISYSDLHSRSMVRAEVRGYVGTVAFVSCTYTDSGGESIGSMLVSAGLAEEYTGLPSLLESPETESMSTQEARSILSKTTAVSTASQVSAFRAYHSAYHPQAFIQGENTPPMVLSPSQCFSEAFVKQLTALSFPGPTLAQSHAWPIILSGRDLLCISPTQSGKTLAYLLPLLHRFLGSPDSYGDLRSLNGPVILVLCGSTREAAYVHMVCRNVISWKDPSKVNLCAVAYQGYEASAVDCLSSGADFLVCTPCSALRLLTTHVLSLSRLCHLVFDNADALAVNYESELKLFMRKYATFLQEDTSLTNRVRPQILIFSAVYSSAILSLMRAYTINRITLITCSIETSVFQGLTQQLVNCKMSDKLDKLTEYLQTNRHRIAICVSNLSTLPDLSRVLANNEWAFHVLSQNVESSKEAMHLLNEWESRQEEIGGKADILILFDDAIERFSINLSYLQVSTLIHFEFPNAGSTKKVFRSRLRLLTESFNKGLVSSCNSMIFLSKELGNKISYLFNFHTRLGYSIPAEISTQLAKIRETIKFSKRGGDLCYYFKSFGECPHPACSLLHRIPQTDPPSRSASSLHSPSEQTELIPYPDIPRGGSIRVLISHVASPSQIWVRILEHYPGKLGDAICPSFSASQALTLNREMQAFSSVWETKDRMCVPRLGQYYALYDPSDNLFYRVQALKFSRELDQLIFFHQEKVEVRCIDTGELKVVYANQLLPLPNHLYQVPRQVVEAVCCLIKPVDKDLDWSPQSCEWAARCLQGKTFTGRISFSFNCILFLDLLENVYSLQSLKLTGSSVSYPQHFINKGFAISNPSHLRQFGIRTGTNTSSEIAYAALQLQSDVAVYISAVETPNLFYVQRCTELNKLNELNISLNAASLPKYNPCVLQVGQLCAARLSVDGKLYRGKVVTVSPEFSYEIYFLDYGDTEWVKGQCVYLINEEFLSLSAQAIPCCLRGFVPPKGGEFISETSAGDRLWDLTRGDILLIAVEESPSHSDLHEGIPMYSVDLLDSGQLILDSLQVDIGLHSSQTDSTQLLSRFRLACQIVQEAYSLPSLEELQSSLVACSDEAYLEVGDWTDLGNCIAKSHPSREMQKLLNDVLRMVSGNHGHRVRLSLSQLLHKLTQIDLLFEFKMVLFQTLTVVEKCGTFYKSVLSPDLLHWIVCLFHESACCKTQSRVIVFMNTVSQNSERAAGLVLYSGILKDWMLSDIPFVFLEFLISLSGYSSLRDKIADLIDWDYILSLLSQGPINHNVNSCYSIFRLLSLFVRNNQTLKQLLSSKLQTLQQIAHFCNDDRISSRFEEIRLFTLSQTSSCRKRPSSKYSLFRMPSSVPPPVRPTQAKAPLSLLWSQSKTQIKICCKIENAISADIFLSSSSSSQPTLDIFVRTREKLYSSSFPLFAAVKKDISRHVYGVEVLFVLTKCQRAVWKQLTPTLAEQKQYRISVDFDRFEMLINSSSEEELSRRTYVRLPVSSSEGSLSEGELIHLSDGGHSDNESPLNS